MAEILKIISPVDVKNRIPSTPKPQPGDAVFDLNEADKISKESPKGDKVEEESPKQELLKNLNREIFLPLLNQTKGQADSIRRLILYAKLFEIPYAVITEEFLNEFFILPKEFLGELMKRDEEVTIFKGDFFEALRILIKDSGNPKLQDAILSILKHFDSYVNQNHSLQAIAAKGEALIGSLMKGDAQMLSELMERLELIIDSDRGNYKDIANYLKNELVPVLRSIGANYPPADSVNDQMLSLIHYIVRYDKADPQLLTDAFSSFAEELKPLFVHLSDEDIADMKETLLKDAETVKNTQVSLSEERDMAALLSKALDKESPAKINNVAQSLLLQLIQSESPMLPLLHFIIPLRFAYEDTYGEFFIDKDCKRRKGDAAKATNIFFTIQSDIFGTFEVDLLARDRNIELDIKCPKDLVSEVRDIRGRFRRTIEDAGFRLIGCHVGEYTESKSIIKRFPHLMDRKAGIDVRI